MATPWVCRSTIPPARSGRQSKLSIASGAGRPVGSPFVLSEVRMRKLAISLAFALAIGVCWSAFVLSARPAGRPLAFALLSGAALGFVLQRTRFCFFCHAQDWFEARDPRGLLAIGLAIAVGLIGYTVVFG